RPSCGPWCSSSSPSSPPWAWPSPASAARCARRRARPRGRWSSNRLRGALPQVAYTRGLHELGDGLFAYLQPGGGALNTHANPDHCFGNELLPTATEIYASAASAAEMGQLSPEVLHAMKSAPGMPPDLAEFVEHAFGPFDFSNITFRAPSRTFEARMDLNLGDRTVTFLELGPAHTGGDTVVHVPDAGTVFTG